MPPLPFHDFRARVDAIYSGLAYSRRTRSKMRLVMHHIGLLGVATTHDITSELAARYVAARSLRVSANTIRGELGYFAAAAEIAVDEGWLERAPRLKRIRPRRSPPARKTLHSIEDVRRVLDLLHSRSADWRWHRAYALAAIVAYTGVRRDEALHIRLEDVDLAGRVIAISARRRLKTEASAADVPICPELLPVLEHWIARCGSPWLLPGERGYGPWRDAKSGFRPTDWIRRAGEELGIEGMTLLSLRHSFATWCRRRWGLSGLQLRDVLRHTTPETQEHYVHADLERGPLVASVARVSYR